jgi:hypothetical protein
MATLMEIGRFIAGNNDYGTLLSFSLMSKKIKKELEPTFYETIFFRDLKELVKEPGTCTHVYLHAYKYTK